MKRTIYADKSEIYSRLMAEAETARGNSLLTAIPRYRREYWKGKHDGFVHAAAIIRDWAGEEEPDAAAGTQASV